MSVLVNTIFFVVTVNVLFELWTAQRKDEETRETAGKIILINEKAAITSTT